MSDPFAEIIDLLNLVPEGDEDAVAAVRRHDAELTKPPGSLGQLERLVEWLARWQGKGKPTLDNPMVTIFAGNHGVTDQGVSAFPREVTAQMVANFTDGGAAISQICALHDFNLRVFELALELPTGDITQTAAMDDKTAAATIAYGMEAIAGGPDCLAIGEMGIGNTTIAAAICAALYGGSGADWVGRGTGVTDEGLKRKADAVDRALALHKDVIGNPLADPRASRRPRDCCDARRPRRRAAQEDSRSRRRLRRHLGGSHRPCRQPAAIDHCIFAHVSAEQAHGRRSTKLGVTPLLDLGMRLGEGSGAALGDGAGEDRAASAHPHGDFRQRRGEQQGLAVRYRPLRRKSQLLALLDHRGEGVHDAGAREGRDHFGAEAQLREQVEAALVQLHDLLHDRQAEAGALLGGLLRQRALAEGAEHRLDLFLGDAGPVVAHRDELAAIGRAADHQLPPCPIAA